MEMIENGMILSRKKYDALEQPAHVYLCPRCGKPLDAMDELIKSQGEIVACEKCGTRTTVWEEFASL